MRQSRASSISTILQYKHSFIPLYTQCDRLCWQSHASYSSKTFCSALEYSRKCNAQWLLLIIKLKNVHYGNALGEDVKILTFTGKNWVKCIAHIMVEINLVIINFYHPILFLRVFRLCTFTSINWVKCICTHIPDTI